MANNNSNNNGEPSIAPQPGRWYDLTLGHSFKDQNFSSKFCTLRYEFKPASIDKSQPGTLHKSKDNRVSVEFQNNQPGKPKVTFEGASEDYKDNDAVLFFDGETFRLERLHRAVKRLRHVRLPGDSAAVPGSATADMAPAAKGTKVLSLSKGTIHQVPAHVDQVDISNIFSDSESIEPKNESNVEPSCNIEIPSSNVETPSSLYNPSTASPEMKNYESEEHIDIVDESDDVGGTIKTTIVSEKKFTGLDIDINLPHQADTDDELADVDVEADKGPNAAEALRAQVNAGPSAAEALRAQVNAEGGEEQTSSSSSSSSSSSGNGSSESVSSSSRSVTSSSDGESSDGSSVNII